MTGILNKFYEILECICIQQTFDLMNESFMRKYDILGITSSISVVVITFRLHRKGLGFDPRIEQFFFLFFFLFFLLSSRMFPLAQPKIGAKWV